MSAFPRSTVGLVSLFMFVAWLVFMLNIPQVTEPLTVVNEASDASMERIEESANSIISGDEGLFGFGILSSLATLIGNLILTILLFIVSIFVSFAMFISVLTLIPIQISGIIVTLLSIGLVFSLIRVVIK